MKNYFILGASCVTLALAVGACGSNQTQSSVVTNPSDALPALGDTRDHVHAIMNGKTDNGNVPGYEIYRETADDSSVAFVHVGFYKDRLGKERVASVNVDAGPNEADTLSSTWMDDFHKAYPVDSRRIPLKSLPAKVQSDGSPSTSKEVISFHSFAGATRLDDTRHFRNGAWVVGPCPGIPRTLVEIYSDNPQRNIAIFFGACAFMLRPDYLTELDGIGFA